MMPRKYFSTLLVITLSSLLITCVNGKKKKVSDCSVCKEMSEKFKKGLSKTAKSNYGGGNTKWEKKLGSYLTSEVRLIEILEDMCAGSETDDKIEEKVGKEEAAKIREKESVFNTKCHSMLEEHEDEIYSFWNNEFKSQSNQDFYLSVCVEKIKVCCPENTFGDNCDACPGGIERPCLGNGRCDGSGTRTGSGKCTCNSGYKGDLCSDCKDGFFERSRNDTHTVCEICHIACKTTCWEEGPKGCDECKSGWLANVELGCQDINECDDNPCENGKYCTNTQGSYTCFSCDAACESCTGSGADKCVDCNTGFTRSEADNACIDNNECAEGNNLCNGENEECSNTPGSYECICKSGYYKDEGKCVKEELEEGQESEDSKTKEEL